MNASAWLLTILKGAEFAIATTEEFIPAGATKDLLAKLDVLLKDAIGALSTELAQAAQARAEAKAAECAAEPK